jgi:hypothetical protein
LQNAAGLSANVSAMMGRHDGRCEAATRSAKLPAGRRSAAPCGRSDDLEIGVGSGRRGQLACPGARHHHHGGQLRRDLAGRFEQPAVLGELLAGILLGNLPGLQRLQPIGADPYLDVLSRIGMLLLLFEVGLGLSVRDLFAVGPSSLGS